MPFTKMEFSKGILLSTDKTFQVLHHGNPMKLSDVMLLIKANLLDQTCMSIDWDLASKNRANLHIECLDTEGNEFNYYFLR